MGSVTCLSVIKGRGSSGEQVVTSLKSDLMRVIDGS